MSQADVLIADHPLPFEERVLFEANPRLVVTKIMDDETELCAIARSGLMSLTGQPGKAPVMLGGHVPLLAVGIYVAVATASALLVCKKTGRGMLATVSVRESLETFVEQAMIEYRFSGTITERREAKDRSQPSPALCRAKTAIG
jgi:crotonobetainyl-CoA:carnitine CoA-transferase CaiB-like acyl-CoA transferase